MFYVSLTVIEANSLHHLASDSRKGAVASDDQISLDIFTFSGCCAAKVDN